MKTQRVNYRAEHERRNKMSDAMLTGLCAFEALQAGEISTDDWMNWIMGREPKRVDAAISARVVRQ